MISATSGLRGERAGFVEKRRCRPWRWPQGTCRPLTEMPLVPLRAHGRKHRYRHGKLQRAGEIDHEYGKRLGRVARYQPCQRRCAEAVRHEPVGKVRRLRLGVALELFRVLDHVGRYCRSGRCRGFFSTLMTHSPSFDDRSAVDIAADLLANGHAPPVMDDWFTAAEPETSLPSSGIMLPMRTMISSPTLTSEMFLSSSVSPA